MKYLLILIMSISLYSCVTQRSCERKFGKIINTETTVVIKDSTIYRDGASVKDTIFSHTDNHTTNYETRTVLDSTGRAQLQWYRDMYGNLIARCSVKPDTFQIKGVRETIREIKTVEVEKKSKGFFEKLGDTLQYLIWFVVISIIVIIAIKTVLK